MMLAGIFTFLLLRPDGPPPAGCATGRHVPRGLVTAILAVTELARKIETRWISILIPQSL